MTNVMSFAPLMRSSVGFDRLNDVFDTLIQSKGEERFAAYPPYNIEKHGDDRYCVVMAVAGFTMNDLNVVAQGDSLSVSGQIAETDKNEVTYLHRGIAARSFQRSFRLAEYIKVTGAELHDGLLTVHLTREVPDAAKPRLVPINGEQPTVAAKKAN